MFQFYRFLNDFQSFLKDFGRRGWLLQASVDVERRAHLAYQRLFADGLGLEGGEAMPWRDFQARFLPYICHLYTTLKGKSREVFVCCKRGMGGSLVYDMSG